MTATHTPDRTAQVHLLAQWAETYPNASRPLRLHTLRRYFRLPELASTNDLTSEQCRDGARWLRDLREQPERKAAVLRKVAAELAPDAALVDTATARLPVAESNDTQDRALSYLERIGEAGHAGRFSAGDCANLLLSLHPEAKPIDVLTEFLSAPEMEKLRAFLCPKIPWTRNLTDEDRLRYEDTAVNTLAELARVAARIPQRLRDLHPDLAFEWFRTAATAQMFVDGRFKTPTEAEIERRLAAASDEAATFRSLRSFRQWCRTGTVEPKSAAEKPDRVDEALAAFRSAFYSCDSIVDAWAATFGPGARFAIREVKR